MYITAVFKSRGETLRFADNLRGYGIYVAIVNTPKAARAGCGLSAKFLKSAIPQARFVLSNGKYPTFMGFFNYDAPVEGGFFG